ncbi:hypothetical protein MSAN_01825200 [Mycena sanguinolenta]|uniref:Uncharacterized protein n=1 Tax=Mycena sanguinolenta TaxID=230812 RepID=A0A8H7CTH5_9AGAR|nr:hypothetical protein MSAN_01825200 [Mycena sanguinolenta]
MRTMRLGTSCDLLTVHPMKGNAGTLDDFGEEYDEEAVSLSWFLFTSPLFFFRVFCLCEDEDEEADWTNSQQCTCLEVAAQANGQLRGRCKRRSFFFCVSPSPLSLLPFVASLATRASSFSLSSPPCLSPPPCQVFTSVLVRTVRSPSFLFYTTILPACPSEVAPRRLWSNFVPPRPHISIRIQFMSSFTPMSRARLESASHLPAPQFLCIHTPLLSRVPVPIITIGRNVESPFVSAARKCTPSA